MPVTDALPDPLPPSPVQERLKLLDPELAIVKSSFPLTAFDPDQAPEAEQLVALEEDHVSVITSPTITDEEDDEIVTVGDGVEGVDEPPPPPPPHAAINKIENKIPIKFLFFIKIPQNCM